MIKVFAMVVIASILVVNASIVVFLYHITLEVFAAINKKSKIGVLKITGKNDELEVIAAVCFTPN